MLVKYIKYLYRWYKAFGFTVFDQPRTTTLFCSPVRIGIWRRYAIDQPVPRFIRRHKGDDNLIYMYHEFLTPRKFYELQRWIKVAKEAKARDKKKYRRHIGDINV